MNIAVCGNIFLAFLAAASLAASPSLLRVSPPGGQRGAEVAVTLEGSRLQEAKEILLYDPDITVIKLDSAADKKADKAVKATLRVAPLARLGEHQLRLRTTTGVTELRTFWVGALPSVEEIEPNNDFNTPQKIDLNVTVHGTILPEDVDHYAVQCRKGQRLTAEIEGMRLGNVMLDPCVAIYDEHHRLLDASDGSTLLMQDSIASIICPRDGKYTIQVHDAAYGGDANAHYRLHVGTFPRPRIAFPLGGQVGQSLTASLLGDAAGPFTMPVQLPGNPLERFAVFARDSNGIAPSPNCLRVSPFASLREKEPNNDLATANIVDTPPPVGIDGVIAEPGDEDWFKFKARKGIAYDVNVYARRLRSPLDPVLYVYDSARKQLATNDDTGGPDSYIRFTPPADGEYALRIRDQLRGGSPQHVYRIEIVPAAPALSVYIPNANNNQPTQERQAIAIPRGGRFATAIRVNRRDFSGEVMLAAERLPQGVKMHVEPLGPNFDQFAAVFEAAADAPLSGLLTHLHATSTDPQQPKVEGESEQAVELITGPNNTSFYATHTNLLAVVVTNEAPFSIAIVPPKNPVPQGGSLGLRVKATRAAGFNGPIALRSLVNPPGLSAGTGVLIPVNQTEAVIPMSAAREATAHNWPLAVLGSADVGGLLWVSSPLEHIEVCPAIVAINLQRAAIERGNTGQLIGDLTIKTPFTGKAKLSLRGLPANTTADDVEIVAGDVKAAFTIHTTDKSPAGQHKALYCTLSLDKNGETITQNAGSGVLRIDRADPGR